MVAYSIRYIMTTGIVTLIWSERCTTGLWQQSTCLYWICLRLRGRKEGWDTIPNLNSSPRDYRHKSALDNHVCSRFLLLLESCGRRSLEWQGFSAHQAEYLHTNLIPFRISHKEACALMRPAILLLQMRNHYRFSLYNLQSSLNSWVIALPHKDGEIA